MFEGFRDMAIYRGRQVFFYKRAQILVADLNGAYDDFRAVKEEIPEDLPELTDQTELTMFADYRVPQILRHRGIFIYNTEMASLIDSETEMDYSSPMEIELRAATVNTVDRIFEKVQ